MEERNYHCLVAGLPDINFGDSALPFTPAELKGVLYQELHSHDYYQLEILLYPYDHANLVRFLQGINEAEEEGLANFSTSNFRDQQELFSAIVPGEDILPSYMCEVMQRYSNISGEIDHIKCRMELDSAYYIHVESVGYRFAKEYTRFEYDFSNLLAFLKAVSIESDPVAGVTGENPFARHLKQLKGGNIVKDHEFDYFDEIVSIEKKSKYSLAEVEYDKLRWRVIDQITLFEDFSGDAVLGYFAKLLIAHRWSDMSDSAGKRRLQEAVDHALTSRIPHLN